MEIINLDMTPSTVTPNAHAGQYDSARTIRFMLKNGGVPFTLAGTETITAEITRSDNTDVTVNVANTSSNYVDVVFDDTVCTVKGLYACELRLKDSDGFDIGSKNFALLVQRDPYDGKNIRIVTVGPADICMFETNLPEPLQSLTVNVLATGGNGTPDNPNPINGYTEANITRCGVNLWDEQWELGYYNTANGQPLPINDRIRSKNFIPITPETAFRLVIANSHYIMPLFYDKDKNYLGYIANGVYSGCQNPFTSLANACYMTFYVSPSYGTTYNNDISINYPATDTTYHAYTGNTYTIAFGQTVYGGVLDVTRGKLHVTWGGKDMGDLTWARNTQYNNPIFLTNIPEAKNASASGEIANSKCEILTPTTAQNCNNVSYDNCYSIMFYFNSSYNINVVAKAYNDVPSFISAVTGKILIYELATPFDIDLTPEVISAIVGVNNVFADCGQSTVKYLKAGA